MLNSLPWLWVGIARRYLAVLLPFTLLDAPSAFAATSYHFSHFAGSDGGAGYADGSGQAARFCMPAYVDVDAAGNLYVADSFNSTVRKISPTGVVTTLAGAAGKSDFKDGYGAAARSDSP